MKDRHHARKRGAHSFSASQPFSVVPARSASGLVASLGTAFSEEPDIHFLLDDTEVMTMALRAGLLQSMLDASKQSPGADRFIVSPPLIVNGLFTAIIYFYGYAEPKDNGWAAIQTKDIQALFKAANNLPVKSIDRRTPVKGGRPWN